MMAAITSRSILTITYRAVFLAKAKKRFDKLDRMIQRQIARKLAERCSNPRVPADALSGLPDCYKIKLRASGIRLVYQVRDEELVLLVITVGPRERDEVYVEAAAQLKKLND